MAVLKIHQRETAGHIVFHAVDAKTRADTQSVTDAVGDTTHLEL